MPNRSAVRRSTALSLVAILVTAFLAGCSDPAPSDTDGDLLFDAAERKGWNVTILHVDRVEIRHVSPDPEMYDTDGDGVSDGFERENGADPTTKDTDGDGLTDCQEIFHTVAKECEDPTFLDHDGGTGTSPWKADSDGGPSRYKTTSPAADQFSGLSTDDRRWGDGLTDGDEFNGFAVATPNGTVFRKTNPREVDSDGDGLEDGEEAHFYFTDPTKSDTDGDGCADGGDPFPRTADLPSITLAQTNVNGPLTLTIVVAGTIVTLQGDDNGQFLADGPTKFRLCNVQVWAPWASIQISLVDANGQPIDVFGDQIDSNGIGTGVWNVATGQHGPTDDPQSPSPFEWTGTEGSLKLSFEAPFSPEPGQLT